MIRSMVKLVRPGLALVAVGAVALGAAGASRAMAETAIRIEVADGGDPGRVAVTAAAVPAPGLGAFTVDFVFDEQRLSPVECAAAQGFFCNPSFATDGRNAVRCGGFDVNGRTGNVDLCTIAFSASPSSSSPSCAEVSVEIREFADVSGSAITAAGMKRNVCAGTSQAASGAGDALHSGGASPSGGQPGAADSNAPAAPGASISPGVDAGDASARTSDRGGPRSDGDPANIAPAGASGDATARAADAAAADAAGEPAGDRNPMTRSESPEGSPAAATSIEDAGRGFGDWQRAGIAAVVSVGLLAAALIVFGVTRRSSGDQVGD